MDEKTLEKLFKEIHKSFVDNSSTPSEKSDTFWYWRGYVAALDTHSNILYDQLCRVRGYIYSLYKAKSIPDYESFLKG